jgi:hypothetical protein
MWPEVCSAHAQILLVLFSRAFSGLPCFFLTIIVVQVVQVPWLPEVTEGNVTPKEFPWKGVRMQNRKLRNIRPSGAFWNVTP